VSVLSYFLCVGGFDTFFFQIYLKVSICLLSSQGLLLKLLFKEYVIEGWIRDRKC
jgi:hypothetical protein